MKPPEQPPSAEEMQKVFRNMQIRMRNYALHQFDHIGPRTVVALQELHLMDHPSETLGSNIDLAVLQDPKHPRQVSLPAGPLLLYVAETDNTKRMVVRLPVLLYSPLLDVRSATLGRLNRMITEGGVAITPKTKDTLVKFHDAVLSDVSGKWRAASVAVNDALDDDFLVALQVVRQSLASEPVIQDSLNDFVPRVLFPPISSLDSIALAVKNPKSEHARLAEIIGLAVSEAKTLAEACAKYYSLVGHLPLAPRYSMGELVAGWMTTHPETNAWEEVWRWVGGAFGPVPRYHACSAFVLHPELVPGVKLPNLWREILGVVHDASRKGGKDGSHDVWTMRQVLARHYLHHIEAHLPGNDGANMANFAWWLAEQVSSLFPDRAESCRFYLEKWIGPAAETSGQVWLAAAAAIAPSFLRYITLNVHTPWASSLLALMGEKLEQLKPDAQTTETRTLFHDALVSLSMGCLPFLVQPSDDPIFALEYPMSDMLLKWAKYQSEDQAKALQQVVKTSEVLGSIDGLCQGLRKIGEVLLADQVAITLALKAKAYTNPTAADRVWEVIADSDWRQRVLSSAEPRMLGLLVDALTGFQVANQGKWFSQLPHFIAELCEKSTDNERRRDLFLYVVHASLASDTVSAIRRLLRGDQKAKFVALAKQYRDWVEAMWPQYPPWVQGRLRAIMASMHVV